MRIKSVKFVMASWVCLSMWLGAATQSKPRVYTISPNESSFWVQVDKAGFLKAFGDDHQIGVRIYSGRAVVPESGVGAGALELEIDARSLVVLDRDVSRSDRTKIYNNMHKEVLESEKYQKITFKSVSVSDLKQTGAQIYSLKLNGDLSLHGVTKRIVLPVTATVSEQQLRAEGQYRLKQSDYGIKPTSAAVGAVKVKDEVVVSFNLVGKVS
ncbi:MAG TPA: YceI family protein [Blastocatellia bacterium]|nr:YceI family protein [Blastocatellia bacterium]